MNFDLANATEGEQELYEVLGRLFRSLFHNVANGVGNRSLEHYSLGLEASKVYTHDLARLEHLKIILRCRSRRQKQNVETAIGFQPTATPKLVRSYEVH